MAKDSIQVAGLDQLQELLWQLNNKGSPDVFGDDKMESTHGRPVSHSSLLRSLSVAKLRMKALVEVQKHLGRMIRSLEKRSVPMAFEEGIKRLPDEILAQIFETGHKTTNGSGFAKRVSQVSRRFRHVAFQTPLLWTRISGTYTDSLIETHTSRAGRMDLEIVIPPLTTAQIITSAFLRSQTPYISRWSHLYILNDSATNWLEALSMTTLPRLSMIEYHHDASLTGLTLPRLLHIRGYRYLRPAIPFLPQLTTFEVIFTDSKDIHIRDFYLALQTMKVLRDLSVTLDGCIAPLAELDHSLQLDRHSVHIDTLNVVVKNMTSSVAVAPIYDCLFFLSPSEFCLSLDTLETENGWNLFYGSDYDFIFPYGSSISIVISNVLLRANGLEFDLLDELAPGFDVARTICIEAPGSSIVSFSGVPDSLVNYPSHLRLKSCDQLTEDKLAVLLDQFLGISELRGLCSLAIISCRQISETFLLNVEDEYGRWIKLTWQL
ncbi:hypothetical protein BD410DRAFT_899047 [Rickenella mellea]|uniref:F-box domain-containing protein n=1 Tax=Rickenella mellea TaxID=50990 RepID=A0A4Y7Q2Z0_9AGAM|nr:hypothetical protein BD410DRAFT_899047 [Rickenella mellea]